MCEVGGGGGVWIFSGSTHSVLCFLVNTGFVSDPLQAYESMDLAGKGRCTNSL